MNNTIRGFSAVCAVLSFTAAAQAASVSAGSGFWAARNDTDSGSATWRFSTPTAADKITWTSGANVTDGVGHALNVFGPEQKFTTAPAVAGRTFTGFTDNDGPGPNGSTTTTSGAGASLAVPGTVWGTNWQANWTVNASGALGAGNGAAWSSQAKALDPFSIFSSQLSEAGVTSGKYDLFFAVGLASTSLSLSDTAGLHVSYQNAAGTVNILDLTLSSGSATVSGSSDARFYLLDDLDEGPTEVSGNLLDLAGVQAALGNGTTPLYLGIVLEDLTVPTAALVDGSLAQIHIESAVSAAAAVPEPSTWLLLPAGMLAVWARRNRRV